MLWTDFFTNPKNLVGTGLLLIGIADDLRSRKFHNWLFLTTLFVSITTLLLVEGLSSLWVGLAGASAAFVFALPLVMTKAIGAGDMKLFVALCFLTTWRGSLNILILSVVWGAALGVIQILLSRQLPSFTSNLLGIVTRKSKDQELKLHQIPYTIALFLGWLSYYSLIPLGWEIL